MKTPKIQRRPGPEFFNGIGVTQTLAGPADALADAKAIFKSARSSRDAMPPPGVTTRISL
jgi:hypothetical protein